MLACQVSGSVTCLYDEDWATMCRCGGNHPSAGAASSLDAVGGGPAARGYAVAGGAA